MKLSETTKRITLLGMFTAIIFILTFTPIGFIQLPFIKATIIHIPVIIGGIVLGAKYGAVLGFMFGTASLISNTMAPTVSSFAFTPFVPVPGTDRGSLMALVICFVPRILVGVTPWFVYKGLKKAFGKRGDIPAFAIAGIAGSLTNTLLVMHLIFLLFKDAYANVRNVAADVVYGVILGVITVNGIPEAIVAGIFTAALCGTLRAVRRD
jgi:uncharacterized membrane protein